MNTRNLLITLALALLAAFTLLNWAAFTEPTTLSLGFTQVRAPLGLIMLVITGLFIGLFLVYILFQQAGVILEARRYAKDLKAHRELADTAEASRFTELRMFLADELRKLEAQASAGTRELAARVEGFEQRLQAKLEESTREVSAYIAEVDDKLDRMQPPRP